MQLLRNYGLGIVLFLLFLGSWIGQGIFQWQEEYSQAQMHGQELTSEEFIPSFLSRTFENWQSEFLQLGAMVVLTSFLIFKGSPQSKDGDEELKRKLERIDEKLNALTKGKK